MMHYSSVDLQNVVVFMIISVIVSCILVVAFWID